MGGMRVLTAIPATQRSQDILLAFVLATPLLGGQCARIDGSTKASCAFKEAQGELGESVPRLAFPPQTFSFPEILSQAKGKNSQPWISALLKR